MTSLLSVWQVADLPVLASLLLLAAALIYSLIHFFRRAK